MVIATGPDAFALAPLAIWIQGAWLTAVQEHPDNVSTVTVTLAPDANTDELSGDTVKRQGAASWVTVTAVPLMSMAPLRDAGTPLGSTRKEMVPLPCPFAVDVRAIQFTPLAASHVQSRVVVTVTEPFAPAEGAVDIELATDTWHFAAPGAVVEIVDSLVHDEVISARAEAAARRRDERIRSTSPAAIGLPVSSHPLDSIRFCATLN